jgi:hypothetical protein
MATKKITQLTELTTPAGNDLLILDDVSEVATKKITVDNILAPFSGSVTASFAAVNSSISSLSSSINSISGSRVVEGASVLTPAAAETTTSLTYTDLATVGPTVTLNIGSSGKAIVTLSCAIGRTTANAGGTGFVSFNVSGATTISADTNQANSRWIGGVQWNAFAGAGQFASSTFLLSGLNPGSTTFTMKYKCDTGTFYFIHRHLVVEAL